MALGGKAIEPNPNVLRRKLRSEPAGPDEQAVSPAKAVRMGVARASESAFNLALRVSSIRQSRLDLADVVEQLEESWALFPLIHDDGSVGVMGFEPACVIAFVEQQTLGHVRAEPLEQRSLTRTDKALAVAFLNIFLRKFEEGLLQAPTAYWTCGYRADDAVASRHQMVLQLDASEFRGFNIQNEVVGSERKVGMRLFLPIKEKAVPQKAKSGKKTEKTVAGVVKPGKSLQNAALSANVEMDAIMCKVMMPLSELSALKPGHLVKLPQNATQQACLVDRMGRTAQSIHLGQLHGLRAVRLAQTSAEAQVAEAKQIHEETGGVIKEKVEQKPAVPEAVESAKPSQTEEIDELDALLQNSLAK